MTSTEFRHPIAKLVTGSYPLPVAFWLWGFAGGFVWSFAIAGIMSMRGPSGVTVALTAAWLTYYVLVCVGIWRSAGRYQGKLVWSLSARILVAASLFSIIRDLVRSAWTH